MFHNEPLIIYEEATWTKINIRNPDYPENIPPNLMGIPGTTVHTVDLISLIRPKHN